MTCRRLYLWAKDRLAKAGVDTPGFDAAVLAERFLGLDRPGLAAHGDEEAPPQGERDFLAALSQREERRPLQYILGSWPFMGLELYVGEGVLVPREDTAVLVEALAGQLSGAPRGLDLCAGTGAVGLGLCSLLPGAAATCVEVDERARKYLYKNIDKYKEYHVDCVAADVLDPASAGLFVGGLDFIAANPPYIAAGELAGLQPEVRREPELALNGGADGLRFYRAIVKDWAKLLRRGGLLGVEIGSEQAAAVTELFREGGLGQVQVRRDLGGLDRAVIGVKT